MHIGDFKSIIETKTPRVLHNHLVSVREANAIVTNYNHLNESFQVDFMNMPLTNIIEFAMAKETPGSFKKYIQEIEKPTVINIPEPVPNVVDVKSQPIIDEVPPEVKTGEPLLQETQPKLKSPSKRPKDVKTVEKSVIPLQEMFYKQLLQKIDLISESKSQPLSVTVKTTESHIERLFEIEKSMLNTLNKIVERTQQVSPQSTEANNTLHEIFQAQQQMILMISESQQKVAISQKHIAETVNLVVEKLAALSMALPTIAPIVNLPAPVVNIITENGRKVTTKLVERDENGMIMRITEDVGVIDK